MTAPGPLEFPEQEGADPVDGDVDMTDLNPLVDVGAPEAPANLSLEGQTEVVPNLVGPHPIIREGEDRGGELHDKIASNNECLLNNCGDRDTNNAHGRRRRKAPKITPPPPGGNGDDGNGGSGASGGDGDDDSDPYKNISLEDIGGLEKHKAYLRDTILRRLQNPEEPMPYPPPKGVLFYGPPGTGKTLLARAFGNDLSKTLGKPVTFYHRKGADFLSMYFGESGNNIRKVFREAKARQPSIIFLDELDGVCPSRDGRFVGQAYTSVVTTLLGEMDTVTPGEVFVFGATNRLDAVDAAMRRPGRFDHHLEFLPPDLEARKRIIQIGTRKWLADSRPGPEDLQRLGKSTPGYTGADLDTLCRNVWFVAFNRHNPTADLDISVDDLKITLQDWSDALAQSKPSTSAVYGSALYTPPLPDQKMLQLINTVVEDLSDKIVKDLTTIAAGHGKWASIGKDTGSAVNLIISTFFITDIRRPSDESLENYVIPGILTQDKIRRLAPSVYRLSKEEIMYANLQTSSAMVVANIVQQARNSLVPCILYVPRIDDIIIDCPGAVGWMVEQFAELREKPVLLLATASVGVDAIKDLGIRQIFLQNSKCHVARKPTDPERSCYFNAPIRAVLTTVDVSNPKPEGNKCPQEIQEKLTNLHNATVLATRGRSLESMVRLHDRILMVCAEYVRITDKSMAVQKMEALIGDYSANPNK